MTSLLEDRLRASFDLAPADVVVKMIDVQKNGSRQVVAVLVMTAFGVAVVRIR